MNNCLSGNKIFCKIVAVSLKETIRLMDEVDEVIEIHGGWPVE
jgi:hypothetical protein